MRTVKSALKLVNKPFFDIEVLCLCNFAKLLFCEIANSMRTNYIAKYYIIFNSDMKNNSRII